MTNEPFYKGDISDKAKASSQDILGWRSNSDLNAFSSRFKSFQFAVINCSCVISVTLFFSCISCFYLSGKFGFLKFFSSFNMLLSSSTDSWVNFGNEISYDKLNNGIIIQKDNYHDKTGKNSISDPNDLKTFIVNIYKTMMLRGIKGTYIYACNKELQDNFKSFIKKA